MTKIESMLGAPAGQKVRVKPDFIVLNDGDAHQAIDFVEVGLANPEKVRIFIDHDVPSGDPKGSFIYQKLARLSKSHGISFVYGQGIDYQLMLDKEVKAGHVILSGGRHASYYGAVGALGLNLDPQELANALVSGEVDLIVPGTVRVNLTGRLSAEASAIDLAIQLMCQFANEFWKDLVVEFSGPALSSMSQKEKAILCAMATGSGAIAALVSDETVDVRQNTLNFDLDQAVRVSALPGSQGKSFANYHCRKVRDLNDVELDAGYLGGLLGGHLDDLRQAAALFKGKRIALGFRLTICPATMAVYLQAMEEGLIDIFIDFGAQMVSPSERSYNKQGAGVIGHGEKLVTNGLYNDSGCQGVNDADIYLGSVETVARAALTKKFN